MELSGYKLPAIDFKKTGQNISRLREEKDISVRELQIMFGFTSPETIYHWQNGTRLPSVDHFIVLAAILGVTIDEIIAIKGNHQDDQESDHDLMTCPRLLS